MKTKQNPLYAEIDRLKMEKEKRKNIIRRVINMLKNEDVPKIIIDDLETLLEEKK